MARSLSKHEREKLAAEIGALEALDIEQLKVRWRTLYQTEPPSRFSRDLLLRAVAYRMQERALGGLRPATRRLFQHVAAAAHARSTPPSPSDRPGASTGSRSNGAPPSSGTPGSRCPAHQPA